MNKSIGIITQARMTSTRLPGKILKSAGGKTLLEHHINRLRWSDLPIYIATTTNDEDNVVENFAVASNIQYYRGNENNVLSRYFECAKKYSIDIIVRVTSDCPLIDGALIKEAVNNYLSYDNENIYLSNCLVRTFPRGFDFEIFSFSLLKEAYEKATDDYQKEHVTPYINQNKSGRVLLKDITYEHNKSDIRITVDTPEDFLLIKTLLDTYSVSDYGYEKIISVFDNNPALKLINAHIEQKKV